MRLPKVQIADLVVVLGFPAIFSVLLACGKYGEGQDFTLKLEYNGADLASQGLLNGPASGDAGAQGNTAPVNLSYFNCLAINVVGPGIREASGNPEGEGKLPAMYGGSSCGYAGVTSKAVAINQNASVELRVPAGAQRLIQVVGVVDPTGQFCGTDRPLSDAEDSSIYDRMRFYEFGRAVLDLYSNKTVGISSTYNGLNLTQQLARRVDCGDGGSGPAGVSSPAFWYDADHFYYRGIANGGNATIDWRDSGSVTGPSLSVTTGSGDPTLSTQSASFNRPLIKAA